PRALQVPPPSAPPLPAPRRARPWAAPRRERSVSSSPGEAARPPPPQAPPRRWSGRSTAAAACCEFPVEPSSVRLRRQNQLAHYGLAHRRCLAVTVSRPSEALLEEARRGERRSGRLQIFGRATYPARP